MEQGSSTSRYILTTLAIILVITTFILVGLNALHLQNRLFSSSVSSEALQEQYKAGYRAALNRATALCPIIGTELRSFSATIDSISGSTLIIRSPLFEQDPLTQLGPTRTIQIDASTIIGKIQPKDPVQLQQELRALKPGSPPPPPTTLQALRLTDLAPGMIITLLVTGDASTQGTLTAQQISLP